LRAFVTGDGKGIILGGRRGNSQFRSDTLKDLNLKEDQIKHLFERLNKLANKTIRELAEEFDL
jgi:hypothetical protein